MIQDFTRVLEKGGRRLTTLIVGAHTVYYRGVWVGMDGAGNTERLWRVQLPSPYHHNARGTGHFKAVSPLNFCPFL